MSEMHNNELSPLGLGSLPYAYAYATLPSSAQRIARLLRVDSCYYHRCSLAMEPFASQSLPQYCSIQLSSGMRFGRRTLASQ